MEILLGGGLMLDATMPVLDSLPADRPVALFVRHAERPELPPDPSGHAIALTDAGRGSAEALGMRIGARLASVRSSPILRCVETARAIGRYDPEVDRMLGDPGPFVADVEVVWSEWRRLGHDGVIARLVSCEDSIIGLHPIRATARALARYAIDVAESPGIHVFVTHDVVLAPLVRVLWGRALSRDEWPGFLEPLALIDGTRALYRDESVMLELGPE